MKSFKLDHIALTITDIKITENFYSNILGLTKIYRPKFVIPGLWCQMSTRFAGKRQLTLPILS